MFFLQKKDGSFRAVDYQNEEDEFVLSFEETDNTEVLDLREFADGDSVNKIHWKLSMNSDDFIVRQYGEEVEKRNTIIVDLTKVKTDKFRDKLDLFTRQHICSDLHILRMEYRHVLLYGMDWNMI